MEKAVVFGEELVASNTKIKIKRSYKGGTPLYVLAQLYKIEVETVLSVVVG